MSISFPFYKIQGCGNDFVVCRLSELPEGFLTRSEQIKKICDRHFGIGSDGLMILGKQVAGRSEVFMFNPDGSVMGMCGNGIRCVVRYMFLIGLLEKTTDQINFIVCGREISCRSQDCGLTVEVNMGMPIFEAEQIPIAAKQEFLGDFLQVGDLKIQGWAISMGNPHFVSFVDNLDLAVVQDLGPKIETHIFFPERTNVEFVKLQGKNSIELLVWERGAGLTLACGSGACAAVVVGIIKGVIDSPCKVALPGGNLEVSWDSNKKNASVFLSGPANEVYSGVWNAES